MEEYVQIIQLYLKPTARCLHLRYKWAFQQNNDQKHTSTLVLKWTKQLALCTWNGLPKALTSTMLKIQQISQ